MLTKEQIDNMSFEEMFRRVRFTLIGDPPFDGSEIGDYFVEVFKNKRSEITHDEYVETSKRIGWEERTVWEK